MFISVIVRTKDQASRLRLVLASLSRQTVPFREMSAQFGPGSAVAELIVVNDGSTDHTPAVLEEAAAIMPLRVVTHIQSQGLAAAANAGARVASGEVLVFLDGDCVAESNLLALHAQRHGGGGVMARGETYHLRCTRFFLDVETGTPQHGQEDYVQRLPAADLARHLVTRSQILEDFAAVERRAQPGIYPGVGPAALAALDWDALLNHPHLSVLWMAATGHNFSVPRRDFEAVGGFDPRLVLNEHRELAFRLWKRGLRMAPVVGARSYHLTHRVGWRDPLVDTAWEQLFYESHPCLAVKLMAVFWMSIGGVKTIPVEARILSLQQLDDIVRNGTAIDYDAIRQAHPHLARLRP